MKNKILLISLAAVLALSLSIAGCTGEGEGEVATLNLAFTDHNPPFIATAIALDDYAEYIEARSCGKISITVAHAGEGLGENEVFGELQASNPSYDAGNYVPESGDGLCLVQVMTLPFMGWGSQHIANDVYYNLTDPANYGTEILGEFPTSLTYVGNYMMPGVQLSFINDGCACCNITTPQEFVDFVTCSAKPVAVMEDTLGEILQMVGVSTETIDITGAMQFCTSGLYCGFAQHLEFCYAFGILECCDCWTIFPGGIVMTPMGVLWNADSYDACVAKLVEACGMNQTAAEAIMDGAADQYVETCYIKTQDPDTFGWQLYLASHGCNQDLSTGQTAVWAANVSSYEADWETGCGSPAHNIYLAAQAAIAYHAANPAGH